MADCMLFLSENRLNRCQIFGRFSFLKPRPNQIPIKDNLRPARSMSTYLSRVHKVSHEHGCWPNLVCMLTL